MDKDELDAIKLHSAGATIINDSPFYKLDSYKNETEIDQNFRTDWVIPFYFNLGKTDQEWLKTMVDLYPKISDEIILKNLGDFNWRTRSTGAYFAAIKEKQNLIDIIGVHLIKSEVCYAGMTYAKVLAFFNSKKSIEYLEIYLDYYLKKHALYFDQKSVISAIKYLDEINNTNKLKKHLGDWKAFVKNKKHWDESIDVSRIKDEITFIKTIQKSASNT